MFCFGKKRKNCRYRAGCSCALAELPAGKRGKISCINSCGSLVSRLAGLGITLGTEVEVISNQGKGPMLVSVRGSSVSLGRCMAERVMVA